MVIFVDDGLSIEPVGFVAILFFIGWVGGMFGLATELAFLLVLAKNVDTGSYVELYYLYTKVIFFISFSCLNILN
jgi:hypothetical protein